MARTMMLRELTILFSQLTKPTASREDYIKSVCGQNILGKRSVRTRELTMKYLTRLYGLDPSVTLFRALRYFWVRDAEGGPLLALLCAYARDSILRLNAPFIQGIRTGALVSREDIEEYLDNLAPGRFSAATLKSTAQNLRSSWTQSGHLAGRVRKVRTRPHTTPGAAAYALLLGYLRGERGEGLFHSEFTKILDCSSDTIIDRASEASQRGWLVFKRVGKVMEVAFPNVLNKQEMEWIREPN